MTFSAFVSLSLFPNVCPPRLSNFVWPIAQSGARCGTRLSIIMIELLFSCPPAVCLTLTFLWWFRTCTAGPSRPRELMRSENIATRRSALHRVRARPLTCVVNVDFIANSLTKFAYFRSTSIPFGSKYNRNYCWSNCGPICARNSQKHSGFGAKFALQQRIAAASDSMAPPIASAIFRRLPSSPSPRSNWKSQVERMIQTFACRFGINKAGNARNKLRWIRRKNGETARGIRWNNESDSKICFNKFMQCMLFPALNLPDDCHAASSAAVPIRLQMPASPQPHLDYIAREFRSSLQLSTSWDRKHRMECGEWMRAAAGKGERDFRKTKIAPKKKI